MWNFLPVRFRGFGSCLGLPGRDARRGAHWQRPGLESLEARLTPAFVYGLDSDWGSGFQAHGLLTNDQKTPMVNWKVEFDYNRDISSMWNGKVASKVGQHYVIVPEAYNGTLQPGASADIGFLGAGGLPGDKPLNVRVTWDGAGTAPLPNLSLADISVTEGDTGSKTVALTVTLSAAVASPVTVAFSTADGTAKAGTDYTAASGSLTFAPGETRRPCP